MKIEISPSDVSDLVPFSPALRSPQISKNAGITYAGISKSGLWMWIVCDTTINIYHTENSEWFGGFCFGESLKNPSAKITAVLEFQSSHIFFPCLVIAVNHDDETLVCICDVNISKVIRTILFPDTVLKLEVVSGNGGACIETHNLFHQLRYMFGIIALGTAKGLVYLLDLCLDEDFVCDEHLPNITYMVKKYELLPERREKTLAREQHIFMLLNDFSSQNGVSEFENDLSINHCLGKVQVSALKYIHSTITLAVGFNYGGIQLWDLTDLCLLFTVPNEDHELPIVAFSFQEPENDPRNFCYLWMIKGFTVSERPDDFSVAMMYSLTYRNRTFIESYGNLYTDLQNCRKRFEHPLTSDPISFAQSSSSLGSCILSCQVVCQTDETHYMDAVSANDSDSVPENTSLCFLSWVVFSNSSKAPASYHLALFDLNQWYQAQMPISNLKSEPSHLSPYFAHFSLEEVVQNFDLENLLGLYTIPHSIKKFRYTNPAEEFFYPSSLDFQTIVYSSTGICKTSYLGVQKSLLYEIAELGPNILSNPKEIFSDLICCGLVCDGISSDRLPLITQRENILQLALEYHLPIFFMKCLKEWKYSDSAQEGCTSRALLNWAWKKVFQIKSSIDKLNLPLFNCSGVDVDKTSLKCLYSYRRQLDLIDTLLMGYQKFAPPRTEQGLQELKCRRDVVNSINMYLKVVLWLHAVHILPEVCEGDETDKNVLYPVTGLVAAYARRRNNLQKIHSSIGPTDILLIDGLVKDTFSDNTWLEKGGNGIYPPPSIYAALSCYLLDGIHIDVKHSLMYYLLLDISHTPHNVRNPLMSEIKKFPVVFGMPQSISQLVKAYWYLDQFKFESAIKNLLDPTVKSSDILQWQHSRVIKSFLFQKQSHMALKYINHMDPPEASIEDMKLHLSVFLSRGSITQAFYYQRSKQAQGFAHELINHLFLGCQETHRLKDLMYLPLNSFESGALINFLSENDDLRSQEALVMYYLLHFNFFEAAKANEKFLMNKLSKSVSAYKRSEGRDALVESLFSSVPMTEKNLAQEVNRFQSLPVQNEDLLQPLSLSVKTAPLKQISNSDILSSLISGANSSMCAPYLEPRTPLKSRTKSFYDSIPFLRPPLTPDFTKPSVETIHNSPVVKRALVSPSSEFSSPTKKSRLLDNVAFRTSSLTKKKIPKHLVGDVATLLQSPPIHRKVSRRPSVTNSQESSNITPQGILKKKVEPSKVSLPSLYTAETPPLEECDSDADTSEDEKMTVNEDIPEDVPGRQIRFSMPSKDELNTSAISTSDMDSSVLSLPSEPALSSTRNQEPHLTQELDAVGDRLLLNVSRRKALFFLKRESIKTHSSDGEKLVSESAIITSENVPDEDSMIVDDAFSVEFMTVDETQQELIDMTEEDKDDKEKYIAEDIDSYNDKFECVTEESSGSVVSSVVAPGSLELLPDVVSFPPASFESAHNRSDCSSGNSSYNSASERSLIVTPRRPLRDNSRSNSTSNLSLASTTAEKRGILTEIENPSSSVDVVDVTPVAIDEVSQFEKETLQGEIGDTSGDHPIESQVTLQYMKELIDNQIEKSLAESYGGAAPSIPSMNLFEKINYEADKTVTELENIDVIQEEIIPETVESIETEKCLVTEIVEAVTNIVTSKPAVSPERSNVLETAYSSLEDVPKPAIPVYVPIKERIRSCVSASEVEGDSENIVSGFGNTSDQPFEDAVLTLQKPDFDESKCLVKSSFIKENKNEQDVRNVIETDFFKDIPLDSTAGILSAHVIDSGKDYAKTLSQRFDFMSKNSDFYENNRLHRETMKLLQDNYIPENIELDATKSMKKARTFSFGRAKAETITKEKEKTSKTKDSAVEIVYKEGANTWEEYLGDLTNPESYEQFSECIKKSVSKASKKKDLKDGADTDHNEESVSIFGPSFQTEPVPKTKSTNRKETSKKESSISEKGKFVKKAKERTKVSKKIEFSFAEPHSPAGPEILEALSTPHQGHIGSFMFSPPLTRGRLRQKRGDDSINSSFASVASDASFIKSKKPPIDPILEEIIAERETMPKPATDSPVTSKTKSKVKKALTRKSKSNVSHMSTDSPHESMDLSPNTSKRKPEDVHETSRSKSLSTSKNSPAKHSMVLRHAKPKPDQLFQ